MTSRRRFRRTLDWIVFALLVATIVLVTTYFKTDRDPMFTVAAFVTFASAILLFWFEEDLERWWFR